MAPYGERDLGQHCLTAPSHYLSQCWPLILVTFTWEQFHSQYLSWYSTMYWGLYFQNYCRIPRASELSGLRVWLHAIYLWVVNKWVYQMLMEGSCIFLRSIDIVADWPQYNQNSQDIHMTWIDANLHDVALFLVFHLCQQCPRIFSFSPYEYWSQNILIQNRSMSPDALALCVTRASRWYWLHKISRSLSSMGKYICYLCHHSVAKWWKMWIYFSDSWHGFSVTRITLNLLGPIYQEQSII